MVKGITGCGLQGTVMFPFFLISNIAVVFALASRAFVVCFVVCVYYS